VWVSHVTDILLFSNTVLKHIDVSVTCWHEFKNCGPLKECCRGSKVHSNEEVEVTICGSLQIQKSDFCCDMLLLILPR